MNPATRHIYLIGFSGSGKSTIGPILARKLGCHFADCDAMIEREACMSVNDIFAEHGEPSFRRLEVEMIRQLSQARFQQVIALGGGALCKQSSRTVVNSTGVAVYLRCSVDEIHRRLAPLDNRPLLQATGESLRRRITRLLAERRPVYEAVADITVVTSSKRPNEVVREIIRRLSRQ